MTGTAFKIIRPRKRPLAKPKEEPAKPRLRYIEHTIFGRGELVGIRQSDGGQFVATVRFNDGTERTLQLRQQFWTTDVARLIPAPLKPRRVAKPKPEPVENDASSAPGEDGEQADEERDGEDDEHDASEGGEDDDGDQDGESDEAETEAA